MQIFVRYLLWLLIVAVPFQGAAAAFMPCGNVVPADGISDKSLVAHADGAEQAAAAEHEEHCGQPSQDGKQIAKAKCSTCASCFVGAAALSAIPVFALPRFDSLDSSFTPEPAMTAFVPASLERPPRHA